MSIQENTYTGTVHYFKDSRFIPHPLNVNFVDQPALGDFNGDGITDILGFIGTHQESQLYCLSGTKANNFVNFTDHFINFDNSRKPYMFFGIIFADMDGDLGAEIVFGFQNGAKLDISVWKLANEK